MNMWLTSGGCRLRDLVGEYVYDIVVYSTVCIKCKHKV